MGEVGDTVGIAVGIMVGVEVDGVKVGFTLVNRYVSD